MTKYKNKTITITFCDCAENHVGMEQIGKKAIYGFTLRDLKRFKRRFDRLGIETTIYELDTDGDHDVPEAYILIAKEATKTLLDDDPIPELLDLDWDKKAVMYGRVVNKKARYNLCFSDYDQEPDYDNGKGRVVSFESLPVLNELRNKIKDITGSYFVAEGNYYYDTKNCGIGWHGDTERRKVIGVRYGASSTLAYQWYLKGERIGSKCKFKLNDGDIYIMSDKAVGHDWKLRNTLTLRHSAGSKQFTK